MENHDKLPLVVIEVQIGTYLGEDDIIRYDDVYAESRGSMKRALITGITGQDGSYLAEFLLQKGMRFTE